MDPKAVPNAVIESYVDDIVRRLPRHLRGDVGLELHALLSEELDAKAREAGRPADDTMALDLVGAFGRPHDVADRYRPASFVIIEPSETPAFALISLVGLGVQWGLTLPPVFMQPESFPGQVFSRLGAWWLSWGLGAFWLPGFVAVMSLIVRGFGHRWPGRAVRTPVRVLDRDRISRPLLALGLGAWAAGAALWVAMPFYGPHLPGVLPAVFAFDHSFLVSRAPWLLPLWAGHYMVYATAFIEGRWRRLTRRVSLAFGGALCGLLTWFVAAGPIFQARPTDDAARFLIALIVLCSLISVAVSLYREPGRLASPKGLATPPGA
jgi:hypothetical protein